MQLKTPRYGWLTGLNDGGHQTVPEVRGMCWLQNATLGVGCAIMDKKRREIAPTLKLCVKAVFVATRIPGCGCRICYHGGSEQISHHHSRCTGGPLRSRPFGLSTPLIVLIKCFSLGGSGKIPMTNAMKNKADMNY